MAANSIAESSENGSVSVDYVAYPPPPPKERPAPVEFSTAQAEMHKKVLEHFQNDAYKIPGIENGELLEVEKFWLVRCVWPIITHANSRLYVSSCIF